MNSIDPTPLRPSSPLDSSHVEHTPPSPVGTPPSMPTQITPATHLNPETVHQVATTSPKETYLNSLSKILYLLVCNRPKEQISLKGIGDKFLFGVGCSLNALSRLVTFFCGIPGNIVGFSAYLILSLVPGVNEKKVKEFLDKANGLFSATVGGIFGLAGNALINKALGEKNLLKNQKQFFESNQKFGAMALPLVPFILMGVLRLIAYQVADEEERVQLLEDIHQ